tara:strand:- start:34 stop:171 length:138 start_codon:yes stop_codon:yes gene_type:complete
MKYYRTKNQKEIAAGINLYKYLFEDEYKRESTSKDIRDKEETSKS